MSVETRWEYLRIVWEYRSKPWRDATATQEWLFSYHWFIYRPGVDKAEERDGWSTADPDNRTNIGQLLNEFGALGWELASDVVTRTTITTGSLGWVGSSGQPIERHWVLKRPVERTT